MSKWKYFYQSCDFADFAELWRLNNSCFILVPVKSLFFKRGFSDVYIYCIDFFVVILENCFSFFWMGVLHKNYRMLPPGLHTKHATISSEDRTGLWHSVPMALNHNGAKSLNFNVWCSPETFLMINFWSLPNYWGHNHFSDLYFFFQYLVQYDLVPYRWTLCCGSNSSALIIISILC